MITIYLFTHLLSLSLSLSLGMAYEGGENYVLYAFVKQGGSEMEIFLSSLDERESEKEIKIEKI
jgi:hypothetical protein